MCDSFFWLLSLKKKVLVMSQSALTALSDRSVTTSPTRVLAPPPLTFLLLCVRVQQSSISSCRKAANRGLNGLFVVTLVVVVFVVIEY